MEEDDDENEDIYNYTDTLEDTDVMEDDHYHSSGSNSHNRKNSGSIPSNDPHKHGSFDHSDDTMMSNNTSTSHTNNELFGISKAILANMLSPRTSLRDARFQLELDGDITMVGRPVSLPVMDIAPHPMVNRHTSYKHSTDSTSTVVSRFNEEIEEEVDKSTNVQNKQRDTSKTDIPHVQVPVRKVVGRQALGLPGITEKRSSELVIPPTSTSSSKSYDDTNLLWRVGSSPSSLSSVPIKKKSDRLDGKKSKDANGLKLTITTQVNDDIAMPQVKLRRRSSAGTQPLDMIKLNHPNTTITTTVTNSSSSSNTVVNTSTNVNNHYRHSLEGSLIPISQLSTDLMGPVDTNIWSAPPVPFTVSV
jgi:hypothetical protein